VGGHRQLGLFGAVGVGAAAVFALLVLPLFIPVKTFPHARPLPLTGLLGKIFQWRERRQKIVLPALLGFSLICAAGVARVGFDGDIARLNGVTPATRRDDETFKQAWGRSLALTTVVVSGATRDAALADNERVAAVLEKLRAEKVIETFSSVAPLLPSAATRAANQNAWRAFWTPTRDAALADALNSTASGLGFRTELFAPWLERLRHFDDGAAPANPALTRLTGEFCNASDGKFYLATLVKTTDTTRFHQTRDAVQAAVPGARLLNKVALGDEITAVARRALPWFAVGVAALNALLIFLLLGRWELVLVTLLPMAAGIFWTLGALGLLGLRVDVANFIFVIFVVGVGGDYSLFQVLSELEAVRGQPDRAAATGGAVTLCALTSLLGTGVLVLARHPALFSVGLTALLGISFSLLATLFLVPPSVRWLAKKYSQRPQLTAPTPAEKLRAVSRRYRLQGAYISHFAFWKMKTDPLFVAVDAAVPMRGEILDVGCGYGLMAQWLTLAAPERRVLGVDFDAEKIRVAQAVARTNQQTTFAHRDLLDGAEFPPCDTALLGDVLHYFPDAVKAELLQRIFAALRPGGRLVLRDAMAEETSAHRTVTRWEKIAVRLGQNRTHHGLHFTDEPTHRALLCAAGFADVEIRRETGRGSNRLLLAAKPA
jgi:SAM-dependent methyltransferase